MPRIAAVRQSYYDDAAKLQKLADMVSRDNDTYPDLKADALKKIQELAYLLPRIKRPQGEKKSNGK